MNISSPQSWNDMALVSPQDPRDVLEYIAMYDQAGALVIGKFARSTTWLNNTTWAISPLSFSPLAVNSTPSIAAVNNQDPAAVYEVNKWNNSHMMVTTNNQLPWTVQRMVFVKAGAQFFNTLFFDWPGITTSTDVQVSVRENSATAGDFTNAASGTIPVYIFTGTFGGTKKGLSFIISRPGRYSLCVRIVDSGGNWSMFELELIAI
jgi:hypothetical protein